MLLLHKRAEHLSGWKNVVTLSWSWLKLLELWGPPGNNRYYRQPVLEDLACISSRLTALTWRGLFRRVDPCWETSPLPPRSLEKRKGKGKKLNGRGSYPLSRTTRTPPCKKWRGRTEGGASEWVSE